MHNVSLGQGQEEVAERLLRSASKCGHWVILQVSSSKQPLMLLIVSSQPHAQQRWTQFGSIEAVIRLISSVSGASEQGKPAAQGPRRCRALSFFRDLELNKSQTCKL